MRNGFVSSLLFVTLALSSFGTFAADANKPQSSKPAVSQPAAVPQEGMVNINSADAETLQRDLNGIGQVKAKAIVEYREANGPFTTVDELLEVKGIGAATLEKNRSKLSVK